jgi:hypothetical protein
MRSNNDKLERLERLLVTSSEDDWTRRPIHPDALAILDEIESLKQGSRWISGKVKVEPEDEALAHFGRPYTDRELCELAVARALEKRGRTTAEIAEERGAWLAYFGEDDAEGGGGDT